MGRKRPLRKIQVSQYAIPPGHDRASTEVPNHGKPTRHHLIPRSQGGKTTPENLLEVPEKLHQSWHHVFGNMTPDQVIVYIATHWVPAGYFDLLVLRQGKHELRIGRKELLSMLDAPPDRPNTPSFRDRHTKYVKPIYQRTRKRRKGK